MASQDMDLDLKLRMQRVFWHMGFLSITEVMVSAWEYETRKRHDVTDIDVLGIQFAPDLYCTRIIADCKGGHESAGRLLWLRGAMALLDVGRGYLVKTRLHANTRALASRLGIATLDLDNLAILEKQLEVPATPSLIGNRPCYEMSTQLWGVALAPGSKLTRDQLLRKKFCQYYDYNYWFMEPYRNLFTTVERLHSVQHQFMPQDPSSLYAFFRVATFFAIALLQAGRDIISKDISQVPSFAKQYAFGGTLALKEKENFFQLLTRYTGENVGLEPPYFDSFLELVNRIVRYSRHSAESPRYLYAAALQALDGRNMDFATFFGPAYDEGSLKIAKDIAVFLVDSARLDRGLLTEMLKQ